MVDCLHRHDGNIGDFARQCPVEELRAVEMGKFMLDAPPEQAAAFAFDPFAVERLRPEHHRSRAHHRRKEVRQRKAPFVMRGEILRRSDDLRIDHCQRHLRQQQPFTGRRGIPHRLQGHVEDDQPQGLPRLRSGETDPLKRLHRLDHRHLHRIHQQGIHQLPDFRRHSGNRFRLFAQHRVADGMHHVTFLILEEHRFSTPCNTVD